METAIGSCIGGVAIGAIGGAILGAALGGNRGLERGALVGAAVGVGRCAVLIEVAAAEDRARVREAEYAAIVDGRTSTRSITTTKGKLATVRTKVSNAPLPPPKKVKVNRPAAIAATPAAAPGVAPPATPASTAGPAAPLENKRTEIASDANGTIKVDGDAAAATVKVSERPQVETMSYVEEKQNYTACRFSEMIIDVDGQSAEAGKQKWCQSKDGSWQPVTG